MGVSAPTWSSLIGGLYAYAFSPTQLNELWLAYHVLHDYAAGTKIYPHIHWTTGGADTGVCRWGMEYTYARGYGVDRFPATQTIYLEQAASGVANTHYITETSEAGALLIPNFEPDGILLLRIFRDAANLADTLTDPAFGLYCDLHYQSDGMLTNERNRTFTKRRGQL